MEPSIWPPPKVLLLLQIKSLIQIQLTAFYGTLIPFISSSTAIIYFPSLLLQNKSFLSVFSWQREKKHFTIIWDVCVYMCFIWIITAVLINICLIAFPKSEEIMFRAKMFHRNSDSMNKSNFDTISHPLLPLPALPKILKRRKQFRNRSKANKRPTLKVFRPWTLVLADGMEWMEKRQLQFAAEQIEIFKFYEVDKLENECWGTQF